MHRPFSPSSCVHMRHLVHRVLIRRIDSGKPDHPVGMLPAIIRNVFVGNRRPQIIRPKPQHKSLVRRLRSPAGDSPCRPAAAAASSAPPRSSAAKAPPAPHPPVARDSAKYACDSRQSFMHLDQHSPQQRRTHSISSVRKPTNPQHQRGGRDAQPFASLIGHGRSPPVVNPPTPAAIFTMPMA